MSLRASDLDGFFGETTWAKENGHAIPYVECKQVPSWQLWKKFQNLVGVQEVRWGGGGTEPAGKCTFLYGKENENHELGTGFCI
jgi:hypothetical protein